MFVISEILVNMMNSGYPLKNIFCVSFSEPRAPNHEKARSL